MTVEQLDKISAQRLEDVDIDTLVVIRISAGQVRARLRFHFPIMGKA